MENKQKNYWDISKRNFGALGVLMVLYIPFLGMIFFNPSSEATGSPIGLIIVIALAVLFFIISSLFKRHSSHAITTAYIYIGTVFAYWLISGFILNPPADGIFVKIIGILVLFYIFDNVRKA